MKRFVLRREVDVSGISGTGLVAEGVQFSDGTCVIRWCGERASTVVWPSLDDVIAIHGHGGATQIEWVGDPGHRDALAVARNIVNQVLDEAGTDVDTRQRINDDCDVFVARLLDEYRGTP